jgi:transposase
LGVESFPTTPAGYHALASWLGAFGPIDRVGVEGTGTYGAGLARHLAASGITVIEVDRPNRQERRRNGKSDELDAIEAARAALSRRATGHAKGGTGNVEALRALLVAKRSARSIRIRSIGQLRHLAITAPDDLRVRLTGLTSKALVAQASVLRARPGSDPVRHATKTAIITLARRVQAINAEIAVLDHHIDRLVGATAPGLVAVYGSALTPPPSCSSPPATTPPASTPKRHGRISAVLLRSPRGPARPTAATGSTPVATAKPTTPCGESC